jgi:hypothetical protein
MRLACALLLVGLTGVTGTASAQKGEPAIKAEAERRNRKANELYQQGRFEEALRLYQAAFDLRPDPRYLFNVGLAREKTFDYEGCVVAFEAFLQQQGTAADVRKQAEERIGACRERTTIPVRFTSAPTNAAVYLGEGDARVLKGRTPQELPLAPGSYLVTMELQGYVARKDTITVEPGKRPQVDFVLDKLSSLRIEVDPAGARVKIDDLAWEAAPVSREVTPGTHQVKIEKAGHERAVRELKVEPGQEVSLVLSLRPEMRVRNLSLRTTRGVAGARVKIDGRDGGPAPLRRRIAPGSHHLVIEAPGRIPFSDDITVPEDRDLDLLVHLEAQRSRRSRIVTGVILGAAILAAVTGGVYGILSLRDDADFSDSPDPMLRDQGEMHAERADIAFTTSAVLTGSAILHWWLTSPSESRVEVVY